MKPKTFRVMTYNVHGCVGTDGRLDEDRIAEVIAQADPDAVALQELDVARSRSKGLHQARHLAERLGMGFHFHPALTRSSEQYGDAVLSRFPMALLHAGTLPTSSSRLAFEPRGALLVELELHGALVHLLNTHLGLSWSERMAQIRALLGREWLGESLHSHPLVVCGDLNALPGSQVHRTLSDNLTDLQRWSLRCCWPQPTFPSYLPVARLDYIFRNDGLLEHKVKVIRNKLTRQASDHLPVVADLLLRDTS